MRCHQHRSLPAPRHTGLGRTKVCKVNFLLRGHFCHLDVIHTVWLLRSKQYSTDLGMYIPIHAVFLWHTGKHLCDEPRVHLHSFLPWHVSAKNGYDNRICNGEADECYWRSILLYSLWNGDNLYSSDKRSNVATDHGEPQLIWKHAWRNYCGLWER